MNLTETEAKTRACCKPSGKMIVDNGPCIASECMAWRWKTVSKLVTDEESGEQTWEYHREIMEALQVMGGGALMSGDHAAWQILMNASIAMEKIQPGDSERVREMIERRIKAQAEHDPKQAPAAEDL